MANKKLKKEISALSVWQPWAWLIVNGHKDIENRDWEKPPTEDRIGCRFAIHASKRRVTKEEYKEFLEHVKILKIKRYPKSVDEFDYGMIVGTAVIEWVRRGVKSYWAQRGYFNLKLTSVRKIKPIKIKRAGQWWFTVRI